MNKVEAIKKNEDITKMYQVLKHKSERDYLFFKLAIHSGLKVTDLLGLTVTQVKILIYDCRLSELCKAHYHSLIKIKLPESLAKELLHYIKRKNLSDEDFLFQSLRTNQILSRQQAYRIIHKAAKEANIEHVGLTTLRKTFAFHAYQKGIPIVIIQKYLGHQSTIETLNFIGIENDCDHSIYITLNL
ncbi:tyrosine-type recombinase/integrase [Staphylococcus sp. SS251]|nr:tyrosine-type recombinase/integrase [Staphylococcus singaporensis]MBE5679085.1 tyrosine-type recombinase/integrase [Staphylococcus singaporensis]